MIVPGIQGRQETTVTAANVATTEVVGVDRRRITFSVKAYDERGLIGEGTHERFVVEVEKFQASLFAIKYRGQNHSLLSRQYLAKNRYTKRANL